MERNERIKRLVCRCAKCIAATLHARHEAASHNEAVTAIVGHDCPLVALGPASTDQTAYARGERGGK